MEASDLVIVMRPLKELLPNPDNPRVNSAAVEMVATSIRRYGFLVPLVVDDEGNIIAGHTRYLAARLLKLERVPTVSSKDLTPELAQEFAIAENRTSDFSFFDLDKLAEMAVDMPEDFIADFDLESLLGDLNGVVEELPAEAEPDKREGLDLAPFEKYQYVTIICRNTYDYANLLERLGLEDLQRRYVDGYLKRGMSIGRVMEYAEFVDRVDS